MELLVRLLVRSSIPPPLPSTERFLPFPAGVPATGVMGDIDDVRGGATTASGTGLAVPGVLSDPPCSGFGAGLLEVGLLIVPSLPDPLLLG